MKSQLQCWRFLCNEVARRAPAALKSTELDEGGSVADNAEDWDVALTCIRTVNLVSIPVEAKRLESGRLKEILLLQNWDRRELHNGVVWSRMDECER